MPLQMISGDPNDFKADALVVPVGWEYLPWLPPGESEEACDAPRTGVKFVFRTSVPTWYDGRHREEDNLRRCWRTLLGLAAHRKCATLAAPVLGRDPGRFPKARALRIAAEEIYDFLENDAMPQRSVYLFTRGTPAPARIAGAAPRSFAPKKNAVRTDRDVDDFIRRLRTEKENFHDMLFRLIWNGETAAGKRKAREVAVYRSIFMSRQQFGKLREPGYTPSKETILWLAVALRLTPEETHELLNTAGYDFCRWKDFDLIVLYFISKGVYDITLINEMLCDYGQKTFQLC